LEALLVDVGPFLEDLDLRLRSRDHLARGLLAEKVPRPEVAYCRKNEHRDKNKRQQDRRKPQSKAHIA
jgi:hypothetical protein